MVGRLAGASADQPEPETRGIRCRDRGVNSVRFDNMTFFVFPKERYPVASSKAVSGSTSSHQLAQCEERIERSLDDAWHALREIHDEQLYKHSGFGTFKDYCETRWGYSKSRAHQLIDHSRIVDYLKAQGAEILPTSEAQTRPLVKLRRKAKSDEDFLNKASEAWGIATDTAPKRFDTPEVTGQHVESAMSHFGVGRSYKKPETAEAEDFRRRVNSCAGHGLVKAGGAEFAAKAKLGESYKTLLEFLIDYDQAVMDED